ncbi:MAG: hypothetical protein EPO21_13060 [Chloroflexota bacterium]|nr:MAG: hypothetical protein EPO21_13060 [Chloroflexota bacterium]
MRNLRQRPIPINERERALLERHRELYRPEIGDTDWGQFLRTATLLGLVGLGLYALAKAAQGSGQTAGVVCTWAGCQHPFTLVIPDGVGRYVEAGCPSCGRQLVVDLKAVAG